MCERQFQLIVFDGYIIAMLVFWLGNSWAFCSCLKLDASGLYKGNLIAFCCSCNLNSLGQILFRVHNPFVFSKKEIASCLFNRISITSCWS